MMSFTPPAVIYGIIMISSARSMDVFISKLRKKLKQDDRIQILNVRGFGYKLTV
jgi:DNA-binding response OmpR family regulator